MIDDTIWIHLSEDQTRSIIDFIEIELLDSIRRDGCFDNVDYFIDIATGLDTIRKGYNDYMMLKENEMAREVAKEYVNDEN